MGVGPEPPDYSASCAQPITHHDALELSWPSGARTYLPGTSSTPTPVHSGGQLAHSTTTTTIYEKPLPTMAPKKNAREPAPSSAATTQAGTTTAGSVPPQPKPSAAAANWDQVLQNIYQFYMKQTPQRTKLIDAFLFFLAVVGALQFLYCILAGNYVRAHGGWVPSRAYIDMGANVPRSPSMPSSLASAPRLGSLS